MDILLVVDDKRLHEMIGFALESRYSSTVSSFRTAAEVIPILRSARKPDFIICEHPVSSLEIFKELTSATLQIPVLIIPTSESVSTDAFAHHTILGIATQKHLLDDLFSIVDEFVDRESNSHSVHDSDFCRIKTDLLLSIGKLQSDIFIRLSSEKYLKIFRRGDFFDLNDHDRIVFKKLDHLYIKNDDTGQFISQFKKDLLSFLREKGGLKEAQLYSEQIYSTIQGLVSRLGPTKEVQELVRSNLEVSLKAVGRSPQLRQVLASLREHRSEYVSAHGLMLSRVGCAIAAAMDWTSSTTFQKINLAAFFHDITLENPELAAVTSMDELNSKGSRFTEDERKAYELHPIHAASIVSQFNEIPADVDIMIVQHHELPEGDGFPRKLSSIRINPISCLFICAHEIVSEVFRDPEAFEIEAFIESNRTRYNTGYFKDVLKSLDRAVL